MADKCIELGRTCVSPDFRSGAVVGLLWGAIVELVSRAKLTYMLGCVSLEGTDPTIGWAVYEYVKETYSLSDKFNVKPRPGFRLKRPPDQKINKILEDKRALIKLIPPIFKGYLRLGGRICGDPAIDREFGTIDFFIMVDITQLPERYIRHFNYKEN